MVLIDFEIILKFVLNLIYCENVNGIWSIIVFVQWDFSLYNLLLFDRVMVEKFKVQMGILWDISFEKLVEFMKFMQKVCV